MSAGKELVIWQATKTDSVFVENGMKEDKNQQIYRFDLEEKNQEDEVYHNKRCPCIQKPEGKDAWLAAVVGVFITFCLALEFGNFGIYYQEYIYMFNASTGAVGWIKGFQTLAGCSVGLVSSVFIKVYGARPVCCLGGLLITVGYLGAAFSPNIYVSYLTHGIIAGIGAFIATTSVLISIQQHFTRNGVLGSGIAQIGLDVGSFAAPIVTTNLIETFGTRGALLMHSAILAHIILFALLLRPRKSKNANKDVVDKIPIAAQLRNELCEFSLLREGLFLCIMLSGFCGWYAIPAFINHLVNRALHHGIPRKSAALLLACVGCFNFVGRLLSTLLANIKTINITVYYGFALLFIGAGSLAYSFVTSYSTMFISPVLFGIGLGSASTVSSVMLVRMFTVERLPRAFGFYYMTAYLGMTLGPPVSGIIFDSTNNYNVPFYLAGALAVFSGLVIFLVAVLSRPR